MTNAVIGALRVNLGLNSAQFSKGLTDANRKAKTFASRVGPAIKGIGLAAAGAAVGIGLAVKGILDDADQLTKAAQKIGIPVDELSRLRHAAELAGVEFAGLQTSVRRLSQNMRDAFEGSAAKGPMIFEQLGISVKDADGNMKSASQVMAELGDAFAAMPDGAMKTAMAIELMGRAGADMIPLLNGGSSALRSAMEEADRLGIVIDEKTGKAAEQFNDNLSRLGKVVSGIGIQFAAKLAPHLAAFTDWLVEISPALSRFADQAIADIGKWIGIGQQIWGMAEAGVAAVKHLVTGIETWITGRLNAIWDTVGAKIQWVSDKFAGLYDAVVGNSYIPDMVDGIGDEVDRLDAEFVRPVENAISGAVDAIAEGTFKARDFFRGLITDLAKMALNKAVQGLFGSLFGGGGGGILGGLGGLVSGLFGGFRANGGAVAAGSSYIVGEHGPELLTMGRQAGHITPNMGGGEVRVVIESSPYFDAQVRDIAGGVAVETTRTGIAAYDRAQTRRGQTHG